MSEELKRCPFCGGRAAFRCFTAGFATKIQVVCNSCEARTVGVTGGIDYNARDKAAALWNKRSIMGEWVPVKDMIPGTQRAVLANVKYPEDEYEIHVAYYDGAKWRDFYMEDSELYGQVIAWMDLPKGYMEARK